MLAFIRFIDDHSWEETGFFAQVWSRLSFLSLPQWALQVLGTGPWNKVSKNTQVCPQGSQEAALRAGAISFYHLPCARLDQGRLPKRGDQGAESCGEIWKANSLIQDPRASEDRGRDE